MIFSPRQLGKSTLFRLWEAAKAVFKDATPAPALVIPNKPFSRVWLEHVNQTAIRMQRKTK
jgi:hypothetical protein